MTKFYYYQQCTPEPKSFYFEITRKLKTHVEIIGNQDTEVLADEGEAENTEQAISNLIFSILERYKDKDFTHFAVTRHESYATLLCFVV